MKRGLVLGIIVLIIIILSVIGYIYFGGEEEFVVEDEEWFQTGNMQNITQLQTKTSEELEDNKIGDMWRSGRIDIYTKRAANEFINDINNNGFKWVRLSIDWFDWEEVENEGDYSEYNINPNQDRAITELNNKNIKIMYNLVYWHESIPLGLEEEKEKFSRFKTEDEIQRYLDYVRFIVSHFKGKIEYYEILNEPETWFLGGYVEPVDYINLVERVVPVIREEYPQAKIVIPATSDMEYLFKILNSDIMPLVDAVSWHPMYSTSPEYDRGYYYEYPSIVQEIKDIASAHGFEGEYIAEELVWRTSNNPGSPQEFSGYNDLIAAKYYARGIIIHLGMDIITGLILDIDDVDLPQYIVQNLATIMAGATPTELSIEIQSQATNIEYYTFSLSNGDKLIALWTDGIAVDDDSGVSADLTFDGLTGKEAIAIDVLNGYTQALTIEKNTINDLIVRDYPLIIQITAS